MTENVFTKDALSATYDRMAKPGARDRIEHISRETRVPANVLIALGDAVGATDDETRVSVAERAASQWAPRIAAGEDAETVIRSTLPADGRADEFISYAKDLGRQLYPEPERPKEEQPGAIGDVTRAVGGGLASGVGTVFRGGSKAIEITNDILGGYVPGAGLVSDFLDKSAEGYSMMSKDIKGTMSDEAKAALEGSAPKGDLFKPSSWEFGDNPSVYGYVLSGADVLGSFLPVVVASVATGGSGALATGAAQSGGAAAEQARATIDQMASTRLPDGRTQLEAESSYYRDLIADGDPEEVALAKTRKAAENFAFTLTAPVGAFGGKLTDLILHAPSKMIGKGVASRVAGKAGLSALEEGAQEAGEQVATNVGTNTGAGTNISPTEDTFANFLLGAMGGAGPGAAFGAFDMPDRAPAPPPQQDMEPGQERLALPAPALIPPAQPGQYPGSEPPAPPEGSLSSAMGADPGAIAHGFQKGQPVIVKTPAGEVKGIFDGEDASNVSILDEEGKPLYEIPREDFAAGAVSLSPRVPLPGAGAEGETVQPPESQQSPAAPPAIEGSASERATAAIQMPEAAPEYVPQTAEEALRIAENIASVARVQGWTTSMGARFKAMNDLAHRMGATPKVADLPDIITRDDGTPFPTEAMAKRRMKSRAIDPTEFSIIAGDGGFVIARNSEGAAEPDTAAADALTEMGFYDGEWNASPTSNVPDDAKAATAPAKAQVEPEKPAEEAKAPETPQRQWARFLGKASTGSGQWSGQVEGHDVTVAGDQVSIHSLPNPDTGETALLGQFSTTGLSRVEIGKAVRKFIPKAPAPAVEGEMKGSRRGDEGEGAVAQPQPKADAPQVGAAQRAADQAPEEAGGENGGGEVSAAPALETADHGPAVVQKPKAPERKKATNQTRKEASRKRDEATRSFFTVGNVVSGYAGHDRVLAFDEGPDGTWTVTVEKVVRNGDEWVKDPSDSRVRKHSSQPSDRDLAKGPVYRAEIPAEAAPAAPSADAIAAAAAETDPNPTEAQKEAENYKTGKINWNGLTLSIENEAGSQRSGKDPSGKKWSVTMPAHYGRILGTVGADGDHVDFYMGDNPESDVVLVIDQNDLATGAFDEHKVVFGAKTGREARAIYVAGFSDGKGAKRIGGAKKMTVAEFKEWLKTSDQSKPAGDATAAPPEKQSAAAAEVVPTLDARKEDKARQARGAGEAAARAGESRTPPEWLGEDMGQEWLAGYAAVSARDVGTADAAPSDERQEQAQPDAAPDEAAVVAEPAQDAENPAPRADDTSTLTIEERDELAALRKRFRDKIRTQLNSGLDPELVAIAAKMGAIYIKAGARRFRDLVRAMIEDLGLTFDQVQPYARNAYNHVRDDMDLAGEDIADMDDAKAVLAEVKKIRAETSQSAAPDATLKEEAPAESADVEPARPVGPGETGEGGKREADRGSDIGAGQPDGNRRQGDVAGQPTGPLSGDEREGGAGRSGSRHGGEDTGAEARSGASRVESVGRDGASLRRSDDAGLSLSKARANYRITDPEALVGGTPKRRFAKNRAAIEAYQSITDEGREPTAEELDAIAAFIGWGSFGQQLFKGTWERPIYADGWKDENDWLRAHLGEEQWRGAQNSIINAHYTDPPTVQAMWGMVERMGFKGGRILEPSMGIGNFFGMMPAQIADNSDLTGIELDPLTGGMAKMLYPQANISIKGYEQSKTPDNFYDLVIGNWPFANFSPADRRYAKLKAPLHDYFFLKALDQVRPGGLVIGITSAFTMDKQATTIRQHLAKHAELVDAFRLPSGAFEQYAGTSVVTDIIILKKRETPVLDVSDAGWVGTQEVDTPAGQPVRVNRLYATYPQNVLGKINFGSGSTYGRPSMIVDRPADLMGQLKALPDRLPEGTYSPRRRGSEPRFISNNTKSAQFSVIDKDGVLYRVEGDRLARLEDVVKYRVKNKATTERREAEIRALVDLRQKMGAVLDADRAAAANADNLRGDLWRAYQAFRKAHGPLAESFGLDLLRRVNDPGAAMVEALETRDRKPAAIMEKATIRAPRAIEKPSITDAFVIARNESATLDLDRIAEIAKKPVAEITDHLLAAKAIYRTPGGGYETSDSYLSGNVRQKLKEAIAAREQGEDMEGSIEGLKDVVPADVPYFSIEAKLGAMWIPSEVYSGFIAEKFGLTAMEARAVSVRYSAGAWHVDVPPGIEYKAEVKTITGGEIKAKTFLSYALNNQTIVIRTKDADGKEYKDDAATEKVNGLAAKLREDFSEWVWKDPERRSNLEVAYNDAMNAVATPAYDGSFLDFSGMALTRGDKPFNLRSHQSNAIWRGILNGRGIYAHEVGTGKTITMAGIAVESRRYGLARKPLVIAHNANSKAVANEMQDVYPGGKFLYVDNLAPAEIKATLHRIATDDWDAIIIPHSLIDRMALKEETLMAMAASEIAAYEQEALAAAAEDNTGLTVEMMNDEDAMKKVRSPTAKQLVKARNQIIEKIKRQALQASKEGAVTFEDLGIDQIIVDEAHEFKKPPIATRMTVKGLNKSVSSRSLQLKFLTDYVKGMRGGKGVHVFTGTPITNTLTEIYHQMRYVMDDVMRASDVAEWDGFFNTFAASIPDVELTSSGDYESVERLSAFVNVAELRRMAGQFMDIVFADDMPEFSPRETANGKTLDAKGLTDAERDELTNGRTENAIGRPYKKVYHDIADMEPEQRAILDQVVEHARNFRAASGKRKMEIMRGGGPDAPIVFNNVPTRAGLDVRLHDPSAPDHPSSKANRAVRNVARIYHEDKRTTQVIFMDEGYSDSATRTKKDEDGNVTRTKVAKFNLAADIVRKLIDQGIPESEIAVVDGSVSKEKRAEIARKMNSREIRVVIGQTSTLGVGVNMQSNLRAMHHLDAPWMPGDLEQRNGRGHRQGNAWNTVLEYRYLTEGLDGRRWQVLTIKDRFIKAFLRADADLRVIEGDATDDATSMGADDLAQTLSEAAGDPRIFQVKKLEKDIDRLQRRERLHVEGIADAKRTIKRLAENRPKAVARIDDLNAAAAKYAAAREAGFTATVRGKTFDERGPAQEAWDAVTRAMMTTEATDWRYGDFKPVGVSIQGFEVEAQRANSNEFTFRIAGATANSYDSMGKPSILSAEASLRKFADRAAFETDRLRQDDLSRERLEAATEQPFQQAAILDKKKAQLADLRDDMQRNPAAAPSWLRQAAPIDSVVFVGGEPRSVTGHRWTDENWFVSTDSGDVAYNEVTDESGVPIYDERTFEAPKIQEGSKLKTGDEARTDGSAAAEETDAAPEQFQRMGLVGRDGGDRPIDLSRRINAEMRRLGVEGRVGVTLAKSLMDQNGEAVAGRYAEGNIALNERSGDVIGTLRHEIIHALRRSFTSGEWQALVRAAKRDAQIKAAVLEHYAGDTVEAQEEEMVAELFRKWAAENLDGGRLQRLFTRIATFIKAVARALRGEGYVDAAVAMERIASGDVGRRIDRGEPVGGDEKLSRSRDPVATLTGNEMGHWTDMLQLGRKTSDWYKENLVGTTVTNAETGWVISFEDVGANKIGGRKGDVIYRSVPALREMLEGGMLISSEQDNRGRPDILAVHKFAATILLNGEPRDLIVTVRESADHKYHYDILRDMADGARFSRNAGRVSDAQVRHTALEGNPVDINMDFAEPNFKPDGGPGTGAEAIYRRLGLGGMAAIKERALGAADKKRLSQILTDAMSGKAGLLSLVPGRALFSELATALPSARSYLRFKEDMDAERGDWHAKTDAVAQEWRHILSKNGEANAALMSLMHDATIAGVDPSIPFAPKALPEDAEILQTYSPKSYAYRSAAQRQAEDEVRKAKWRALRKRFIPLPGEFKAMFGKVRDTYTQIADAFEDAVVKNVEKSMQLGMERAKQRLEEDLARIRDDGLEGQEKIEAEKEAQARYAGARSRQGWGRGARLAMLRQKFESNRVDGPYFPLSRFGQYFVTVRDDETGKVLSFSRFETAKEQADFVAEQKGVAGQDVKFGVMAENVSFRDQVDPNFVADIEEMIGHEVGDPAVMDMIWQRWLETLPDFSMRKGRMHRKGTAGFDTDAFRAFGKNVFHGGHQIARLKYAADMQRALEKARVEAQNSEDPNRNGLIVNEMEKRHEFTMNPTGSKWSQWATSAAFGYYLGVTPAAALVNISQTTVIGIPMLASNIKSATIGSASRALMKAAQDFTRGRGTVERSSGLTPDEKSAVAEAYRRGTIDKTQSHDLAGVAENGIEYSDRRVKWMGKISYLFHHTERLNREVTFLAAYRLARADGMGHAQAIEKASDLTWKTHFDYQNTSRPRVMQSDVAKVLLTFRNYQVNMLWRLFRDIHQALKGETPEDRKEARSQLIGITSMMALHAGITGTWGYGILVALLALFGGKDDDEVKDEIKTALVNTFGQDLAGIMLKGAIGHVTGTDLSERMGMPDLWFRSSDRNLEGEDVYTYWLSQMVGPVPSMVENSIKGIQRIGDGDVWRGVETLAPKSIRDLMKSSRYMREGVTTYKGDAILDDVSAYQAIVQSLGFTPAQVAERYQANTHLKNEEQRILDRRDQILSEATGKMREGEAISASTLAAIRAFNAAHPSYPISGETLRKSLQARITASRKSEFGIRLNDKLNSEIRQKAAPMIYQ